LQKVGEYLQFRPVVAACTLPRRPQGQRIACPLSSGKLIHLQLRFSSAILYNRLIFSRYDGSNKGPITWGLRLRSLSCILKKLGTVVRVITLRLAGNSGAHQRERESYSQVWAKPHCEPDSQVWDTSFSESDSRVWETMHLMIPRCGLQSRIRNDNIAKYDSLSLFYTFPNNSSLVF
jgi:hypothetical protein